MKPKLTLPLTMRFITICFLLTTLSSFAQEKPDDLAIKNASIFDVNTGRVINHRTVLIKDGIIRDIVKHQHKIRAIKIIDANNKLLTPSFIDTHIHPTDVFGDYDKAPRYLVNDSLKTYRRKLTDAYLPYGVTTVLMLGQPENWLKPILDWSKNPLPNQLDILTAGGALISAEDRPTYIGHAVVQSPEDARQKVTDYYKSGIRHIKLYWRLKEPELQAALKAADSLDMKCYGHIDQNVMTIDKTLDLGLKNYEHLVTLPFSILVTQNDLEKANKQFELNYGKVTSVREQLQLFLEMFRYIDENKKTEMNSLIMKLAKQKATFSSTINLLAELFKPTKPSETLSESEKIKNLRTEENFKIFMKYVKLMHDQGIKIRIGTDMEKGGQSLLAEQILLAKYGFSPESILQICTINGASALGIDNRVGSIEKGKKADLILWEKNPLTNYLNFNSKKIIIKDGAEVKGF
jgi:imidazolonepropionase-like amidohydrolase